MDPIVSTGTEMGEARLSLFTRAETFLPHCFVRMICTKAGFRGWYGLAAALPILNIILFFFLAFAEWPALRRLRNSKEEQE